MNSQSVKYQFNHQQYQYEYNQQSLQLIQKISRADVTTQNPDDLLLLQLKNDLFLDVVINWQEDYVDLKSSLPVGYFASEVKDQTTSQKLKLLLNLMPLSQLLEDGKLTTFIHPQNIYLDYNGNPKLIYRGIVGLMPGSQPNDDEFLRQIKCLAGYLFTKHSFDDLYNGLLPEIAKESRFLQDILAIDDLNSMQDFLKKTYEQYAQEEKKSVVKVPRKKFFLFKQLALWFGIALILTLIPLGYLLVNKVPTDTSCLNANTDFLAQKYDKTINDLQHVKLSKLGKTQKYELAYSYVQGKGFDTTQRNNIMKNITLQSNPNYLNFWIMDGRGQLDDALATAKQLQDSNLIMYALLEKMDSVKTNKKLNATKREQQLESLQSQYNKYNKSLNKNSNSAINNQQQANPNPGE
ncbi:type VII secretion protein EssB [Ligilactobacillus aviarius]|uniref:type VII secretion protein EssB n=1 Tax=Ligilactobacillus aviarius TaxID=1606 RepID=UPI0024B99B56|nr:type VII secretion protein EssB [Ligilactobacillus aviarius]